MKKRTSRYSLENLRRLTEAIDGLAKVIHSGYENEMMQVRDQSGEVQFQHSLPTPRAFSELMSKLVDERNHIRRTRKLILAEGEEETIQ